MKEVKIALYCATLCVAGTVHAHEDHNHNEPAIEEITVSGRAIEYIGQATSGSEGSVGYADFENRPFSRVGELVEVIPGLVATQHSGSGKANQFFLRGFNLDHGTDFAAFADGTPINFRTHGHGQGYLDLNFIIPELTERLDFRKGTYYSDVGDFNSAATASFKTYDELDSNIASITIGENDFLRGLLATSFDVAGGNLLVAAETSSYDSPFELNEDLEKFNAFVKYSRQDGDIDWRISLSAYDSKWNSSDQIPLRAVTSDQISRLGFIDPDLGGDTTRIALSGGFDTSNWSVNAYALYYDFTLFSNFTEFLNDPINGDEFEQRDERVTIGGSASYTQPFTLAGLSAELRTGGDIRYDDIFNIGLFNTAARERLSTVRDDEVSELSLGGFAEIEVDLTERLRATVGLRADVFTYDVDASIAANSDDDSDSIVTPTASLAWNVNDKLELYANYGQGFHSNDVRGAAISVDPVTFDAVDPVDVLVRAEGAELGLRFEHGKFNATLVGFWLELDSELVFVGDAGTTEPNNGSERVGIELNTYWHPTEWLSFDASAGYTDARFLNTALGEDSIPQAVESVFAAGVTVGPIKGFTSTLRLRHFGQAPLTEDGSVFSDSTTLLNLGLYKEIGSVRLGLDVLNLLDSEDADITYFFESQLAGEASPVEDIHFKPVEPRQIRASVTYHF